MLVIAANKSGTTIWYYLVIQTSQVIMATKMFYVLTQEMTSLGTHSAQPPTFSTFSKGDTYTSFSFSFLFSTGDDANSSTFLFPSPSSGEDAGDDAYDTSDASGDDKSLWR